MVRRDVVGRYRGSAMGLLWSFLHPVFMLTVYTFVFSVVFKSRWGTDASQEESRTLFAMLLFAGMIVHGLFADVLNRAPGLILSNANYVKKVVFPIEILPVVTMGSALFHAMVSLLVLIAAYLFLDGVIHWTIIFVPLVFVPLVLFVQGVAWFLASIGVYLRDVGQTIAIFTMMMLFLSPIFYPITALPLDFRPWLLANPLTFIIEQTRSVLILGNMPDWQGLGLYMVAASLVCWVGYFWFQKTRKGFADVL